MFTRSSRHSRGIMTSFYSICIVLGTVCVNPLSAVPELPVSGHVGSTAVLPCELQTEVTGTPHIIWKIESETVFERHGEEAYQGEGYEGRVDITEEELRKGNCALVLRNLTTTDAALYWSTKIVSRTKTVSRTKRSVETETVDISRVYLSVEEKQKEEREAEKEVPRAGVWTGVGVGVTGTIAVIAVIALIVAVLYWCKIRRKQNRRNPDPPHTTSPANTQINPANTSPDEDPNDQGEDLQNTSPDDRGSVVRRRVLSDTFQSGQILSNATSSRTVGNELGAVLWVRRHRLNGGEVFTRRWETRSSERMLTTRQQRTTMTRWWRTLEGVQSCWGLLTLKSVADRMRRCEAPYPGCTC